MLNNGVMMPTVGFGTAGLGDQTAAAVKAALLAGYRHLDSAQSREWYREDHVGAALGLTDNGTLGEGGLRRIDESSSVPLSRMDLFITTKIHPNDLGYNKTLQVRTVTMLVRSASG